MGRHYKSSLKQALRGLRRGVVFLVVLAVALAVFGIVSMKIVFTPERLKFLLIDQLETALHRPVVIDSVSINPLGGVRIEGFKLLRRDKPGAEPLVESKDFIASFKMWPLLIERRMVIDEVWLAGPKIQLIRFPDGTYNYQDLFVSTGTKGAGLGPVALSIAEARITNGRLVFTDEMKGRRHTVDRFQLHIKDFRHDGPFYFGLSFSVENKLEKVDLNGIAEIEGRLNLAGFNWSRAQLDLKNLQVNLSDWRLSARGYVADFLHPRGAVDATLSPSPEGVELKLKNLKRLILPQLAAQVSFSMSDFQTLKVRAFQLQDRHSRLEGDGDFHYAGSSSTWRGHLKSSGIELSDAANYWEELARYNLGGKLAFEVFASSGPQGLRLGRTQVSLEGARAVFGVDRIRNMDAVFTAPPDIKVAKLRLSNLSATWMEQVFTGFSADADIHGPDWTVSSLKGDWNGMHWNLRGKVKDFFSPSRVEVKGGADLIKIQDIVDWIKIAVARHDAKLKRIGPKREKMWFEPIKYGVPKAFPALAGRLTAKKVDYDYIYAQNFAVRFDVSGMGPGMKSMNGFAQFEAEHGRIKNIPEMMEKSKFLRVVFLPFVTLEQLSSMGIMKGWKEKQNLDYTRIYGDYLAAWGNVINKELVIDTTEILMSSNGQYDLPVETLQLYVLNRLYKTKGVLPETLTCDDGKPCLAFFVEGPMGHPDVRLDFNKIRTQKGADVLKKRLEQFKILRSIIPAE